MQQTSRHLSFFLPLILVGALIMLGLSLPSTLAYADSSQQVTVGVGETTLTINGQTSPGTFVTVLNNTIPIGTTSADNSGNFSLLLTFNNGGINELSLFGRTPDGQITDQLTASINVVDFQNTLYYAFLPPTISLNSPDITLGKSIQASGETIPGGTITVTTDTGTVTQTNADTLGDWSVTIPATSAGLHYLFAVASDGIGQQSPPTRRLSFIVTGSQAVATPPAPIIPIRPAPSPSPVIPIITSPQDNQYVSGRTLIVQGSGSDGSLIEVWQDGQIVGSAYASANGSWQIPITLTSPHSVLQARTCRFGVCSDFSPPVNVYFSTGLSSGSPYSALELSSYSLSAFVGQPLNLPLLIQNGTAPYTVTITWGDHAVDNKSYVKAGTYTLSHAYSAVGFFNGTVTVADGNNIQDVHHFAVRITEQPLSSRILPPLELLGLVIIVLLALRFLLPRWLRKRSQNH